LLANLLFILKLSLVWLTSLIKLISHLESILNNGGLLLEGIVKLRSFLAWSSQNLLIILLKICLILLLMLLRN